MMKRDELLVSVQRALLFNVLNCMRFIFVEIKGNILLLRIYTDRELTDDERDICYAVGGEICGDFIELIDSCVEIFMNDSNYELLDKLAELVYARYESQLG